MREMEVVPLVANLEPEWNAYVRKHPGTSPAHLLGWRNVVRRTYGHVPYYLMAREGGQVLGVLPLFFVRHPVFGRFFVTAPFLSHGGISADNEEATHSLVDAARALCREQRARYVELRNLEAAGRGLRLKEKYSTSLLPLDASPDVVWGRCEYRARKATRKALRMGLVVERGPHLLNSFASVISHQMRDLGTPFHGRLFYQTILEEFPGQVEIFTIRHGGQLMGGGLTLTVADTIHWIYGGCLMQSRELAAMNLLTWEIISFACLQKNRWFDFGRSSPDSGTDFFKRQWGAQPTPIFYEYYLADGVEMPDMDPTNRRFRIPIAVWRRLPVPLARRVGPFLIRGIP